MGLDYLTYSFGYEDGYKDAQEGKPSNARAHMRETAKSDGSRVKPSGSRTAQGGVQPSAQELANRAAQLQADREKAGKPISNAEAVKVVYEEAGIPLT
jgi:hypothetical protein